MNERRRLGHLAWLGVGLAGCGALDRQVQYTSTGPAQPRADAEVQERFERAREVPTRPEENEVVVLIDTLPEGLTLEAGVLEVEAGYPYEILGKFELTPQFGFFPGYQDDWRRSYCHPQQILVVGTLFLWTVVPLYYPCFTTTHLPKAQLVDDLRRVGHQAGGNLVIASYAWEDQRQATSAFGFVLKKTATAPVAAPCEEKSAVSGSMPADAAPAD